MGWLAERLAGFEGIVAVALGGSCTGDPPLRL
jgi:hypothetical protein